MPAPIHDTAAGLDLSPRVFQSTATVGNPANASEAVVCRVTVSGDIPLVAGVLLIAYLALRISLNATALRMRVRQTGVNGAVIVDTGAIPETANTTVERQALAFDTGAVLPGQVYVLTSEAPDATNPSTVGAVALVALAV